MDAITVNFNPIINFNDEQFFQLCQHNKDVKFERNAKGEIIIMTPTGGETGKRNFDINVALGIWNQKKGLGICFDSSTGFKLPNGATRSPDVAWIPLKKWDKLSLKERQKFLPFCPDFIIELRSPSDDLKETQEKMQEYMENGCFLGWLINPQDRQVEIYRQGKTKKILDNPQTLSGENILPEFELNIASIW